MMGIWSEFSDRGAAQETSGMIERVTGFIVRIWVMELHKCRSARDKKNDSRKLANFPRQLNFV